MSQLVFFAMFVNSLILATSSQEPFVPSSFNFSTLGVLAANGSSAVAGCSSVILNLDRTSTCNTPSTSVLFDRNTPTLAGLNGDTWASQLMIYNRPEFGYNSFSLYFDFSANPWYSAVSRVEVTIFNCPQWGTGVYYIQVQHRPTTSYRSLATVYPTLISCTSLVRVCIPFSRTTTRQMGLYFSPYSRVEQVHIAEVAFYSRSSPCPPFTKIPGAWPPLTTTERDTVPTTTDATTDRETSGAVNCNTTLTTEKSTTSPTTIEASAKEAPNTLLSSGQAEGLFEVELKGSSSILSLLVVLAVIMTLQTSVIFIVVMVVAFKYKKNKESPASHRESIGTTNRAFEVEERLYDSVTVDDRGVVSTSGQEKRSAIQLKKNVSYAS